jgi:hypothetical protein
MPSIPQDFHNIQEVISFCKVRDLILAGGLVVYGFELSLNSSLQPPLMVFVKQVTVCELIFQAVGSCVGFLGWIKFKA